MFTKDLSDIRIRKDMYHAILKVVVLKKIKDKKTYSYKLLKETADKLQKLSGKKNIKNDIYNTVSYLEKAGYIKTDVRLDGNRVKKYYTITSKGNSALKEAESIFSRAVGEAHRFVKMMA